MGDAQYRNFALSLPSVDATAAFANLFENQGHDFYTCWDQANGFQPHSIHTPDVTPLAEHIPTLQQFYDPAPVIAVAAQHTERIKFLYGSSGVPPGTLWLERRLQVLRRCGPSFLAAARCGRYPSKPRRAPATGGGITIAGTSSMNS
jgi:hypothetical protein